MTASIEWIAAADAIARTFVPGEYVGEFDATDPGLSLTSLDGNGIAIEGTRDELRALAHRILAALGEPEAVHTLAPGERLVTVECDATATIRETWTLAAPAGLDLTPDEWVEAMDREDVRALDVADSVVGDERDRSPRFVDDLDVNPYNTHPDNAPVTGALTVGRIKAGWTVEPCGNPDCDAERCPMPPEGATVRVTVAQEVRESGTDWPEVAVDETTVATVEMEWLDTHQVLARLADGRCVFLDVDDLTPA